MLLLDSSWFHRGDCNLQSLGAPNCEIAHSPVDIFQNLQFPYNFPLFRQNMPNRINDGPNGSPKISAQHLPKHLWWQNCTFSLHLHSLQEKPIQNGVSEANHLNIHIQTWTHRWPLTNTLLHLHQHSAENKEFPNWKTYQRSTVQSNKKKKIKKKEQEKKRQTQRNATHASLKMRSHVLAKVNTRSATLRTG